MAAMARISMLGCMGSKCVEAFARCCSRPPQPRVARLFHGSASNFDQARCPYEILEVDFGASKTELKRAYMTMARKLHPDVSTVVDAKERFAEVNGAYQLLSNDETKRLYDTGQIDTDGTETEYAELNSFHEMLWRQVLWEQR